MPVCRYPVRMSREAFRPFFVNTSRFGPSSPQLILLRLRGKGNGLEAGLSNAYYPPQERSLSQNAVNFGTQMESGRPKSHFPGILARHPQKSSSPEIGWSQPYPRDGGTSLSFVNLKLSGEPIPLDV